jgi:hypothetical protein
MYTPEVDDDDDEDDLYQWDGVSKGDNLANEDNAERYIPKVQQTTSYSQMKTHPCQ